MDIFLIICCLQKFIKVSPSYSKQIDWENFTICDDVEDRKISHDGILGIWKLQRIVAWYAIYTRATWSAAARIPSHVVAEHYVQMYNVWNFKSTYRRINEWMSWHAKVCECKHTYALKVSVIGPVCHDGFVGFVKHCCCV